MPLLAFLVEIALVIFLAIIVGSVLVWSAAKKAMKETEPPTSSSPKAKKYYPEGRCDFCGAESSMKVAQPGQLTTEFCDNCASAKTPKEDLEGASN